MTSQKLPNRRFRNSLVARRICGQMMRTLSRLKIALALRVILKRMSDLPCIILLGVSRGKLSHPPSDLFDLCLYYYTFYESRKQKCCQKIFLEAFEEIYSSTNYKFDNIEKINRRFANCFFKAFVKKENSAIKSDNQKKNKLKRKLNS